MIRLTIGALVAALALPSTVHLPARAADASDGSPVALFGPPWISIEYPVNPYDATTRDAFLVVHAFHHGTPMDFPVSGTAEGLVEGRRQSVSLEFQKTSRPGVYALRKQWPNDGAWTLLVAVAQGPDDKVQAIVELGGSGGVASVRVPTRQERGYTLPARVAMSEIDAELRARAARLAAR